jgi:hypothetical protein
MIFPIENNEIPEQTEKMTERTPPARKQPCQYALFAPTESFGGSNWRDCQNAAQDQAGDFQRSQF